MEKKNDYSDLPNPKSNGLDVNSSLPTKNGNLADSLSQGLLGNNSIPVELVQAVENKFVHGQFITKDMYPTLYASHQAYFQIFQNERTFMVATAYGFHLFHLAQIVCFEYVKEKKRWEVTLLDQTTLQLKRNTTADDILQYSLKFFRINQQIIINLDYLNKIENNLCLLTTPARMADKLIISRNYMKMLQQRVEMI
jgi:DNA-binding LytR/AlgR family response regulator